MHQHKRERVRFPSPKCKQQALGFSPPRAERGGCSRHFLFWKTLCRSFSSAFCYGASRFAFIRRTSIDDL